MDSPFRDAPADSSELPSFRDHRIERVPQRACGGPVPERATQSLGSVVTSFRWPEGTTLGGAALAAARTEGGPALVPNSLVAAWFCVPALCGAAVWLLGMMGW
jgi:hypothetical protein